MFLQKAENLNEATDNPNQQKHKVQIGRAEPFVEQVADQISGEGGTWENEPKGAVLARDDPDALLAVVARLQVFFRHRIASACSAVSFTRMPSFGCEGS